MASTFKITFTRWTPATGRREQSAPTFIQRDTFREAVDAAFLMLDGMKCADPASAYEIETVNLEGLGGNRMNGHGGHIWSDVDLSALGG